MFTSIRSTRVRADWPPTRCRPVTFHLDLYVSDTNVSGPPRSRMGEPSCHRSRSLAVLSCVASFSG